MTKSDKEHHEKWLKIAQDNNIVLPDLKVFGLNSVGELLAQYRIDENLNNIPLKIFDNLYFSNLQKIPGRAMFYGACIYKTLLRQLLIDKGLLNTEIMASNRFLMAIDEAKRLNNWLDCDVIQDAINDARKLIDSNKNDEKINALEYLKSAVLFRTKECVYFLRLIDEFKELAEIS